MATQIIEEYGDSNPVIVSLLYSALLFSSQLFQHLNKAKFAFQYSTMNPGSYGKSLKSGELTMGALQKVALTGRRVIILDDLCDTVKTLQKIRNTFLDLAHVDLKTMVFLSKKEVKGKVYEADYISTTVPLDAFLIGFGLDYLSALRNTPSIKIANKEYLPKSEEHEAHFEKKYQLTLEILSLQKQLTAETNKVPVKADVNMLSMILSCHDLQQSIVSAITRSICILAFGLAIGLGAGAILAKSASSTLLVGSMTFFASKMATVIDAEEMQLEKVNALSACSNKKIKMNQLTSTRSIAKLDNCH